MSINQYLDFIKKSAFNVNPPQHRWLPSESVCTTVKWVGVGSAPQQLHIRHTERESPLSPSAYGFIFHFHHISSFFLDEQVCFCHHFTPCWPPVSPFCFILWQKWKMKKTNGIIWWSTIKRFSLLKQSSYFLSASLTRLTQCNPFGGAFGKETTRGQYLTCSPIPLVDLFQAPGLQAPVLSSVPMFCVFIASLVCVREL